jgi:hypothetical protein
MSDTLTMMNLGQIATQQGYIADSLSDKVAIEDSFFSPAVQGHVNSRLLMMLETPSHTQRQ